MKFICLALICFLAQLTGKVPQGLYFFLVDTAYCSTTEDSCAWGIAAKIADTLFKNVYVGFQYYSNAGTVADITSTLGKYPQLKAIPTLSCGDNAAEVCNTNTLEVLQKYPDAAGILYSTESVPTLATCYTTMMNAGKLVMVERDLSTTNYPEAIYWPNSLFAANAIAGMTNLPAHCGLRLGTTTAEFNSSTTAITALGVDYIDAGLGTDGNWGTYSLSHLQAVGTYLQTGLTCQASCATCIGDLAADCLTCATKYTMNTTTSLCVADVAKNDTTSGSCWISAISLLAFLLMI